MRLDRQKLCEEIHTLYRAEREAMRLIHRLILLRYNIPPDFVLNHGSEPPGAMASQPVAADLRRIVTAMKAEAYDLERGRVDYACLRTQPFLAHTSRQATLDAPTVLSISTRAYTLLWSARRVPVRPLPYTSRSRLMLNWNWPHGRSSTTVALR